MRSGVLVAVLALAACEAAGVKLEIDTSGDPTIDELRVYVGKGSGTRATIVTPQASRAGAREGTYWPRDGGYESIPLAAGQAEVELDFLAGSGLDKVSVVVVGLSGGQPTSVAMQLDVRVPDDVVTVWSLALAPAAPASPDDADLAGLRVELWGEEPGKETCVRVTNADPEHPNVMIVHGDHDKDCDGFHHESNVECDDTWWRAEGAVSTGDLNCLVEERFAVPGGQEVDACMLGGAGCRDGEDHTGAGCVTRPPVCAPSLLCDKCKDSDPVEGFACGLRFAEEHDFQSAIVCDLYYTGAGLCEQTLRTPAAVAWGGAAPLCVEAPRFHDATPGATWASKPHVAGADITIDTTDDACQYQLSIVPNEDPFDQANVSGLMTVKLASGRYVAMPYVLRLNASTECLGGAEPRSCVFQGENLDPLRSCIDGAPL